MAFTHPLLPTSSALLNYFPGPLPRHLCTHLSFMSLLPMLPPHYSPPSTLSLETRGPMGGSPRTCSTEISENPLPCFSTPCRQLVCTRSSQPPGSCSSPPLSKMGGGLLPCIDNAVIYGYIYFCPVCPVISPRAAHVEISYPFPGFGANNSWKC
jgi:hypothetical protein